MWHYPTTDEIIVLHKKHAPTSAVFELVFTHCQIVAEIAAQLIEAGELGVDSELVRVGALVHDIGVYRVFDEDGLERRKVPYICHGVLGEEILKNEGFPEVVWRMASHHTGVGITEEEVVRQHLPLPVQDYSATTDEERLVMYADKFHSKTKPPYFNAYEWYRVYVGRFGAGNVRRFEVLAEQFGKPALEGLGRKYGYGVRV